jgi:hypothetical protein
MQIKKAKVYPCDFKNKSVKVLTVWNVRRISRQFRIGHNWMVHSFMFVCLFDGVNAIFNNISVILWHSVLLVAIEKHMYKINVKENRSVNQEWTIQRHWLQRAQQNT